MNSKKNLSRLQSLKFLVRHARKKDYTNTKGVISQIYQESDIKPLFARAINEDCNKFNDNNKHNFYINILINILLGHDEGTVIKNFSDETLITTIDKEDIKRILPPNVDTYVVSLFKEIFDLDPSNLGNLIFGGSSMINETLVKKIQQSDIIRTTQRNCIDPKIHMSSLKFFVPFDDLTKNTDKYCFKIFTYE
jgi:hypothetical protein